MNGNLKVIDIFSDGTTQHFKQWYILYNATLLKHQDIQMNCHFFATSHGKGAVDSQCSVWEDAAGQNNCLVCLFQ